MPVSKNRRKSGKKAPKTVKRKQPEVSLLPPLPDGITLEEVMDMLAGVSFNDNSGGSNDDPLWRAQELVFDAWEARTKRQRIKLARQALEISGLCADAYVLLAEEAAKTTVEAREYYEQGVAAGEAAIGPEAFENDVGYFWAILETRPYMRARTGLAHILWQLGQRATAVSHMQDMLRLNPNDNQGLRYILSSWLLSTGEHKVLQELLDAYEGDSFAGWSHAKALLLFREEGDTDAATNAVIAAWVGNTHVADLLTGAKSMPKRLPDFYAPGSKEEAILYVHENRENWAATPGALNWLADIAENQA